MTELADLAERLLQLANDEGTAQIHDAALDLMRIAQRTEHTARLSASEAACYRWPEDTAEHRAMRAAFMDGAAHIATPRQ
jgi:hypothetical protein